MHCCIVINNMYICFFMIESLFHSDLHIQYLKQCLSVPLPSRYVSLDSNRMTLVYFIVSGLDLLNAINSIDKKQVIDWIYRQQVQARTSYSGSDHIPPLPDTFSGQGGFRGGPFLGISNRTNENNNNNGYDYGHIAMTYTALCILFILGDDLSRIRHSNIILSLKYLQRSDGSFGPLPGHCETDVRFVYCACAISTLLQDWSGVDIAKATEYIVTCQSSEGGFGQQPMLEPHGGSTYCAIASLYLMSTLNRVKNVNSLVQWLLQRVQSTGGFNGRPHKPSDSCYTFWVGATLTLLNYNKMIPADSIYAFVLSCQQLHMGGFGKYPQSHSDPLHTYYSLAGMSVLGLGSNVLQPLDVSLGITKKSVALIKHINTINNLS